MDNPGKRSEKLINLQNKSVDVALIVFAVMACVIQTMAFFRALKFGFNHSFFWQAAVVLLMVITAIFRKRLGISIKIIIISTITFIVIVTGIYAWGLMASGKIYIAIFTILISLVLSFRKAIIALLIFATVYLTFAFLFSEEIIVYNFDLNKYAKELQNWILDFSVIILTSFGLLILTKYYRDSINKSFLEIKAQNIQVLKEEKKLKESEERYKKLVESFPDVIMISDLQGKVVYANKHLKRITGLDEKDFNNPDRKARIHPDDLPLVSNELQKLLSTDNTHSDIVENRFIDIWGNIHWLSGTMSKLFINDEILIQTVSRDITDKKASELELQKYRDHLEDLVKEKTDDLKQTNEELLVTLQNLKDTQSQLLQAEKMASLGVLTAGVAHEINNPLNYIMGGFINLQDYLKKYGSKNHKQTDVILSSIKNGIERASDIVKSLNRFSHKSDSHEEDCDIHSIVDNCLVMLYNQYKHHITINKYYDKNLPVIKGNVGQLHQVFINLLINSVQAIENKGEINITTKLNSKDIHVIIADTGRGIAKDHLSKITDPFFTTKDPGKGTGLGLSISYKIIKEHKGFMEFKSKINEGTTALIKLPVNI